MLNSILIKQNRNYIDIFQVVVGGSGFENQYLIKCDSNKSGQSGLGFIVKEFGFVSG